MLCAVEQVTISGARGAESAELLTTVCKRAFLDCPSTCPTVGITGVGARVYSTVDKQPRFAYQDIENEKRLRRLDFTKELHGRA